MFISIFNLDFHGTAGTVIAFSLVSFVYFLTKYISTKVTTIEATDNKLFRLSSNYLILPFLEFTSEFHLEDIEAWKVIDISHYGESFRLYLRNGEKVTFTKESVFFNFNEDHYKKFKADLLKLMAEHNISVSRKFEAKEEEFFLSKQSRIILYLMWSIFSLLIFIAIVVGFINNSKTAAVVLLLFSAGICVANIYFVVKYYMIRNKHNKLSN